ncbi:MAG: hypothetical protein B6I36_09930 [Desulfobacteraceae bacterium 4572_35.1]|nr:MAG: hypothetical protein B6I36_09930 [Desulfobacteraceae bacterium 4572_35.1]
MSEQSIIDLESRIAFQEHSLQELHDLVAVQQKQLYDLEELCKLLLKKVNAIPATAGEASNNGDEKPPHY